MKLGCCSAVSPCFHQREHPNSLCGICQEAADGAAETIRDRAARDAVRLLTSLGYTVEPPPVKEPKRRK